MPAGRVGGPAPDLAHVTIDLGAGTLVSSDVIDRRARGIYAGVAAARGFGWYVAADGGLRPNPRYARPPRLEEVRPPTGPGRHRRRCTETFRDSPSRLEWLSDPASFGNVAPALAARIAGALG